MKKNLIVTVFLVTISFLSFTISSYSGSLSDGHILFSEHGKYSESDLASCGECHSLHPQPDTEPNSWGWIEDAGTAMPCKGDFENICAVCHGNDILKAKGPACTDCHIQSPFILNECNSCHANVPSGKEHPDRAGSHLSHNLPEMKDSCAVCHEGSGSMSGKHYDEDKSADVSIMSIYNSKNGTASYNAEDKTCSNVRCHGGKKTPAWGDDYSIVENLDCKKCHEWKGDQYIGVSSAGHHEHINSPQDRMANMTCDFCHDPNLVAENHYQNIENPEMNGKPGDTIYEVYKYFGPDQRSCNGSCHSGTKLWGTVKNPNSPNSKNPVLKDPIL